LQNKIRYDNIFTRKGTVKGLDKGRTIMKKAWTIVGIIAGIVSVVTAVVVVCLYMKEITGGLKKAAGYLKALKEKIVNKDFEEDLYEE